MFAATGADNQDFHINSSFYGECPLLAEVLEAFMLGVLPAASKGARRLAGFVAGNERS